MFKTFVLTLTLSLQCESILSFNYYMMMYSVVNTYITEGDSNDIALQCDMHIPNSMQFKPDYVDFIS